MPNRHSGDPGRVEALHGKGIERAALAAQRRVLARGAERLGHEQVVDAIGVRRRAAQPDRLPGVEQGRLAGRKQQRADRGPAEAVEPQRAVRFEHMAVRAHPAGLPAAAGEIPLAGQAIAAVDRSRARSVWRSPGHDAARISEDGVIGRGLQIGGDQAGTVGDEYVPRDRGVVPGEFFDRRHVERRLRLVAARRARQQHAEQPRGMQPLQQRLGDAPRALDLVGRGGDLRPELAGAGDRVRTGLDVHAPPRIGRPLRPTAPALSRVGRTWRNANAFWQRSKSALQQSPDFSCCRSWRTASLQGRDAASTRRVSRPTVRRYSSNAKRFCAASAARPHAGGWHA